MCTRSIVEATQVTSLALSGGGSLGAIAAGEGAKRALEGKRVVGSDIFPKAPKVPPVKPPPDIAGAEKRRQARTLQRTLAGRPGPGRAATIFSRGTGAGPVGLKTKTGQ